MSLDEVARARMRRCAESRQGHEFDEDGRCVRCELTIVEPK